MRGSTARIFQPFLTLLIYFALAAAVAQAERPLTVFAAASLNEAMGRIGAAFEKETGTAVTFSFAGTGALTRQIEAGAPADVFVSADDLWMAYARDRGAVVPETVLEFAGNTLVIVAPRHEPPVALSAAEISLRLGEARLAMADPETVPAGRYGRAALDTLGLWQGVENRLATMDNVRIALASVARGDTPLGLVYATDAAIEPSVEVVAELPADTHPVIRYSAARTSVATHRQSDQFLMFLRSAEAQKILRSLGFLTDNVN